jgi:hypothetical protein
MKTTFILAFSMIFCGSLAPAAETSMPAAPAAGASAGATTSQVKEPAPPKESGAPNDTTVPKDGSGAKSEPVIIHGVAAKEVTATVRLIRSTPETEVFFKDLKDSLIIPKDSQHNKLYDLCEESRKKGTPVKLLIDPIGRRILAPPKSKDNGDSAGSD